MEELIRNIFSSLNRENIKDADKYMLHVCNMFSEETTPSTIASYIHLFFIENQGVIEYIRKVYALSNSEKLKSLQQCFEVVYMLLNNFPRQMEDYYIRILHLCINIQAKKTHGIKQIAAEIIHLLVTSEEIDINETDLIIIFAKLKFWLQTETSTYVLAVHVQCMGALARKECIKNTKNTEITTILICFLRNAAKHKSGVQSLLHGGYTALQDLVSNGALTGSQLCLLYESLKTDTVYRPEYNKKGNRAALHFFTANAKVFDTMINANGKFWADVLQHWLHSNSKDDSKAGFDALDVLYEILAMHWKVKPTKDPYFSQLVQDFRNVLERRKYDAETKLATRGLGYMAPVCFKFLNAKKFQDLFIFLMQRVEYLLIHSSKKSSGFSGTSCDYIQAISRFLKELTSGQAQHIIIFKRVTIVMIKLFPRLLPNNQDDVINSFFTIFLSIRVSSLETFTDFLSDVVKQGVLWTCSHTLAQEVEILQLDQITYKNYLPLWKGMLEKSEHKEIQTELFNELMKNLIYMSNKLNFNVTIKEIDGQDKMDDKFQAEKINDFKIFANLADFYAEMLSVSSVDNFKRWIHTLSSHMIRKSMQQPLVSGFYKLLAACLKLCEDTKFFTTDRVEKKEHVRLTYENVKNFLEYVLKRVKQYKNELQLAGLLFILHMPVTIIKDMNHDFTDVFKTAFKIGHSNYELANIALTTLHRWFKELDEDVSLPLLRNVVPCMDAYLRNQFIVGDSYEVEGRKAKKYTKRKLQVEAEPELVQLQHNVLQFLSIMPNDICKELISTSGELKLNKGHPNLLKIGIPIGERNISLWMDIFLDRVLLLSLECTDRKIRITACELLHSIVAIFLGTSVQMSHSSELDPILEKLLKALLQLSCDQDLTVLSLFHPVLLQLAHWFAQPKQTGSTHSHIFIETLMDGVSNANDGAVRDQAGVILQEFVAWTRKQNSKRTLKDNLHNIKLIIDNLKQFCLHPDDSKRYGATVIFNHIYKELREEEICVDKFWLEILYAFVMNLSLVKLNDSNDDLLLQINLCLDRVARCLLEKHAVFQRIVNEEKRSTPPKFTENTFDGAGLFLLHHTSHLNIHCRTKCIQMFNKLPITLTKVLEHFDLRCYMHDLEKRPCFTDVKSIEEVLRYYECLTCWIDGHIFIMRTNPSVNLSENDLWGILNYFLSNLQTKNLEDIQHLLNIPNEVLLRRVKEEFSYIRSKLAEKILELFESMLTHDLSEFMDQHTWTFLRNYLFNYNSLGLINVTTETWETNATKILNMFLETLKFNSSSINMFSLMCREYISIKLDAMAHMHLEMEIPLSHRQFLRGLIVFQRTSLNSCVEISSLTFKPLLEFCKILGINIATGQSIDVPKLKDTFLEYFTLKLELALDEANKNAKDELQDLLKYLGTRCQINNVEMNSKVELGYYLFLIFKKTILKHTAKVNKLYLVLSTLAQNVSFDLTMKFYKDYLKYLHKKKIVQENQELKQELMRVTEYIWEKTALNVNDESSLEIISELRMIVNDISSEKLLNSVVTFLGRKRDTELQQMHYLTQAVKALGIVAPRGFDEKIEQTLQTMKRKNAKVFQLESKRDMTTLFIKNLFEATYYSQCLNFFVCALDLYITIDTDFDVDTDFCKASIEKIPRDLQQQFLNGIFCMTNHYTFQQNIVLTLCLCNLLAYCKYEVFELFYISHIASILEAFSLNLIESKTLSCIFINRLFGNINVDNFETNSCPITHASCAVVKSGRELLQRVAKILLNVCKDTIEPDGDPEVFRLYQCYGYNALATVICNTQKGKQDYYQRLFSRQNEEYEDILWSKMISLDKQFNFDITTDDIPKKKKVLVDIRSEKFGSEKKNDYIESQSLFLSTLAEDVTMYDFTDVSVRSQENADVTRIQRGLDVEIFLEEINRHECMLQICGVIKHMHENELLPSEPAPKWTFDICTLLLKNTTPVNVRQFLCKVIENSQVYLKIYAKVFTCGIIRTICDTCTSLNSLACDLIVMLITTWSFNVPSEAETTLLIRFIMDNVWNERRDIFKYNVGLLKTAIETYQNFMVPHDIIESSFVEDVKSQRNLVGVHLVNIFLVNNMSPFRAIIKTLARSMISLLDSSHRNIYTATAETIGLMLKYLDETNHQSLQPFIGMLNGRLQQILTAGDNLSYNRFADMLENIVKHYPEFGRNFLQTTFNLMHSANTDGLKAMFLQIYVKCIGALCDTDSIKHLDVVEWLSSVNLEIQIITLEIILQVIEYLEVSKIEKIIKIMNDISTNNSVSRSIFIDILIAVYRRFHNGDDNLGSELIQEVKKQLISGFVDVEPEIRNKVCTFWTENDIIPQSLETKMIFLLENLYDAYNEDVYLAFGNFLLLNGIHDMDEPIFRLPLHQCEFKNYEVTAHWRAQNASVVPMFTASQQSQEYYLRATQSYTEFDATQVLATQRNSYMASSSSLAYTSAGTKDDTFKNPNDLELSTDYKVKKWRFFKDKADVSKMHAIRESKKGIKINEMIKDAKMKREAQVKIYRSYRTGDFPDIQINVNAVVGPLRELIKKDGQISQLLFKSLFDSIVELTIDDQFMQRANNAINNIFNLSTSYNPTMMGAFLHIALEYRNNMTYHPNVITKVANTSGTLAYGCLLLEEYLIKNVDDGESSSKRGVAAVLSNDTMLWVRLAELYKNLEEWDVVHGIFQDKMTCPDGILKAIQGEAESRWRYAREYYVNLIKDDYDLNRKDFYYDAFFRCSEELSDWKEVEKYCLQTLQGNELTVYDQLWSSEWNKDVLLPYFIKSQVRQENKSGFEDKLKELMKDPAKKQYLRNEFADELTYLYLDSMKIKLTKSYAEIHANNFLNDWKFIKPFYTSIQNKMLLNMKNCVEISVLLKAYETMSVENYEDVIEQLTKTWHKSSASVSISLKHIEATNNYRQSFIKLLKLKLRSFTLEPNDEAQVLQRISDVSFKSEVNLIQQALHQNNITVVRKYTKKNLSTTDANGLIYPISSLLFSQAILARIKLLDTEINVKDFLESFKAYYKCVNSPGYNNDPSIWISASMHLNSLCKSLVETSEKQEIDLNTVQNYFTAFNMNQFSDLLNYGYESMRDTLFRLEQNHKDVDLADAYLKLAKDVSTMGPGFTNKFIEFSLKSMNCGSVEARLLFPHLLNVDGLNEIYKTQFIQQTGDIPVWMFIRWIPQLLAHVDTNKVTAVMQIVMKLATVYPNSLIYAYKLSKDKYTYTNMETYDVVKTLDELLENELVDKLLCALNYVSVPSVVIKSALLKLKKACGDSEYVFRTVGQQIVSNVFKDEEQTPGVDSIRGTIYKSIERNKTKLMSIINHTPFERNAIIKKIDEFKMEDESKESVDLGHYSPWLKYFHASDYERDVEIPGRYLGNARPLPHYHPKISKFSPDVTVFRSYRKPIRISICASDVKEYRFLVKYGEDLRLDQRIQQLFKLMNVILSADAKCHARKLNVSTFEVIPLTSELGFIQWVEETEILRNVMHKRSSYKTINHKMNQAYDKYTTWINKAGKATTAEIYAKATVKYTKAETVANYNQVVNILPWDTLRTSFWNITTDPEVFFALRHTFVKSYAVMCICNWLLGIGDRHLQNILLNMHNGNVVGIDFGHAFGSATQQQPVPELVPFRLTPQIVNLMLPFKESGLLRETMAHTLRALRENHDVLLSTMNIFVLEPTLEWSELVDESWNAQVILELAKSKFAGENPLLIMIKEVEKRTKDSPEVNNTYVQCLKDLLMEASLNHEPERHDVETHLSPNEQVKYLIAQATEANLLGRMWQGWEPWI